MISPASPVAETFERSTFRSLASFLIGGLAITSVEALAATTGDSGIEEVADGINAGALIPVPRFLLVPP